MKKLTAKEIMIPDVLTVDKEWSVDQLSDFLIEHSITGAPVLSSEGKLEGVVSLTDIARNRNLLENRHLHEAPHDYYLEGELSNYSREVLDLLNIKDSNSARVEDIMTPVVFSVSMDTPVAQVADAMIRGRIHRVFVTRKNQLVGIITTLDMLQVIKEYG